MKNLIGHTHKKLNMTLKHRENLTKNMLSILIAKERIQTTLAKAQFIQRHLHSTIEHAKQFNLNPILVSLSQPVRHVDKLFSVLAPRYLHSTTYSTIIRNGTRDSREDSDNASLAILELKHSPNSIRTALAMKNFNKAKALLIDIEEKLYDKQELKLIDPETGLEKVFIRLHEKTLPRDEKQRLQRSGLFY